MDTINIKKNLHQIWTGNKLPEKYLDLQNSFFLNHKDWNYKLWNLDECRILIKTKYPFFLEVFDNYEHIIQKIDSSRLFILNEYGGLYSDLDIHFFKNIEPLLKGKKACIFESNNQMVKKGANNNIIIDNYIMYNNNSVFFNKICKQIKYFIQKDITKTDILKQKIYCGGGSHFITNFLKINKHDVTVFDCKHFESIKCISDYTNQDYIYGIHFCYKSWIDKGIITV